MVQIFDADSGKPLGTLTTDQLQWLIDQLEEEGLADQDYYISGDTLDNFEDAGCPKDLLAFLRKALGSREDMDIRWERG
jgi:hypothetical protein